MKKLYIFLFLILSFTVGAFSKDEDSGKREKMKREVQEFRMKYLAQEMELTEVQKKKFFEVYEQFSKKREECFKEARKLERDLKKNEDASEADYQKATEAMNKATSDYSNIEKEFDEKFAEFLSPKQIYQMKEAEKNFNAKVKEMKHEKRKHKGDKKK